MWKLVKPALDTGETYRICIRRVRNPDFKTRLQSIENEVVQASVNYDNAAKNEHLHTIDSSEDIGGKVTKKEMSKIYTNSMAKKDAPGRHIYDEILLAPINGVCPLCGHGDVKTLDHYLPKSHYPAFVVTPINLVPACSDCNKAKKATIPSSREDLTIHPYYDDIQDNRWLYAEVIQTKPAGTRFFIDAPARWSTVTTARMHRHFKQLKLGELYASQAAVELVNIRYRLKDIFKNAGALEVQRHLLETAKSRLNAHTNSWQTATYEAFAQSEWFFKGGFM
jgi:5-methylcytosine-specific restriction endonuclease McrA